MTGKPVPSALELVASGITAVTDLALRIEAAVTQLRQEPVMDPDVVTAMIIGADAALEEARALRGLRLDLRALAAAIDVGGEAERQRLEAAVQAASAAGGQPWLRLVEPDPEPATAPVLRLPRSTPEADGAAAACRLAAARTPGRP